MKSLSEIETTSKRASKAAGFSWGVSEEVGKSIRLLELFGFPGIKNLSLYYERRIIENFQNLTLINKNNESNKLSLCPIALGISFLDQIKSLENLDKFTFKNIAFPILFLPFLSRGSEIIGKRILFKFDNNQFLLNLNVNISSNFFEEKPFYVAKNIEVNFLENKNSFTENDWKNLYTLSEDTFVEESESLKRGSAGAGLIDND